MAVLSARRPARQMAEVRHQLCEAHGATFVVAGEPISAVPTPRDLLQVAGFPGIPDEKLSRLHGVA
ncbi:MAG: hypothetical protein H0V07_08265 [Propionibacteriales bacterium]|nr:hypothetical protein [Propionibacteriales bacterium]